MSEQFGHIGSKYEVQDETTPLPIPERHTFRRLVRDLGGKRVLDLACGSRHYSRFLKTLGAEWVEGVDISPEMIQLAREFGKSSPSSALPVMDARELSRLGTSTWCLRVSVELRPDTRASERGRIAFANLKPGGRYVSVTADVFDMNRSNFTAYGVEVMSERSSTDATTAAPSS